MIKVLLFDVDGVLANSKGFKRIFSDDHPDIAAKSIPFFKNHFHECVIGAKDLKIELEHQLSEWGWEKGVDEFLKYWFESEHKINEQLIAVIEVLKLKGIKSFLATNQEKHRSKYIMETMGFATIFEDIFTSCTIGHDKEDDSFFDHVLTKLDEYEPQEILFWDDLDRNITCALRAGICAEVYTDFENFRETLKSKYSLL